MPDTDTDIPETTLADGATAQTPPPESPPAAPVTDAARPHPLEPGGERYEQVWARMRQAERDAEEARQRADTAERKVAQPAPPAITFYTPDQLQTAVDQGRITATQASAQLALQAKEQAKTELRGELQYETRRTEAAREVDQFIARKPALMDTASDEFRRVAALARDVAADTGLALTDPRVQRQALRQAYGSVDRLQTTARTEAHARTHADVHAETGRGGGAPAPAAPDALKHVPQWWVDYWRPRVANEKELAERAKFYRPTRKFTTLR